MSKATILIIDDEEKLRQLLARIIELEGYSVLQAANARQGWQLLAQEPDIQLVITDVKLPDENGIRILEKIRQQYPLCQVIVITAFGTIHDGVRAMKLGAFDYITKGDGDDQILVTVERAVEKAGLQRRIADLEKKIETRYKFDQIIGQSPAIREAIGLAQKVAPTDSFVLLTGETGTGKELFAQSIHTASPRRTKPFVAVNCSAIPRELLESAMFGHKKGSFSGAVSDNKGLFEEANDGTLFLDEIGEMNPDLQAKLLRVLETMTFTRIGDTKLTRVDVRVISATNRNLLQESQTGQFRLDLYYRLSVFQVPIPALRERREDIGALATFFLHLYATKTNKRIRGIEPAAVQKLANCSWKGNIRELKNVIERAVILCDTDQITTDLLPPEIRVAQPVHFPATDDTSIEAVEKAHIQKILTQTSGNKAEAAKLLHIGLTTLYRKLHEYGLE